MPLGYFYPSKLNTTLKNNIYIYLRIIHIGIHKVYYETHDLFSSTKSQIYDKEKHKRVKVITSYKSTMGSNKCLFDPTKPKIGHIQLSQDKVTSTYAQESSQ